MKLVKSLQKLSKGIDDRMENAGFQLFKHSALVKDGKVKIRADGGGDNDDDDDEDDSQGDFDGDSVDSDDNDVGSDDDGDDDDGDDDDGDDDEEEDEDGSDDDEGSGSDVERSGMGHSSKWKSNLAEKAAASFLSRFRLVVAVLVGIRPLALPSRAS